MGDDNVLLSPLLKWLQWRCGPDLWPEHSDSFPSSSLTEADGQLLEAALTRISVDFGSKTPATVAAPKDLVAPQRDHQANKPVSDPSTANLNGTLTCKLLRAANLTNADLWSQSDVYCKLSLADSKINDGDEEPQEKTSTTIEDCNDPEWGEEFKFDVGNVKDCALRYPRHTTASPQLA